MDNNRNRSAQNMQRDNLAYAEVMATKCPEQLKTKAQQTIFEKYKRELLSLNSSELATLTDLCFVEDQLNDVQKQMRKRNFDFVITTASGAVKQNPLLQIADALYTRKMSLFRSLNLIASGKNESQVQRKRAAATAERNEPTYRQTVQPKPSGSKKPLPDYIKPVNK
ncbi:hypothetical protein HC723_09885 [Vibrio sp. S11_S32]|uniref:hypothetical protein n=1 Tax=Vibrio sp. S11_S32 TaxID=2720225 RepID=UPI0016806920|nr:hypothetical protein [Vibrio sp. S11_S32]MBD1576746.1 hypothetical protein [Vibrio sp. S11_S32]